MEEEGRYLRDRKLFEQLEIGDDLRIPVYFYPTVDDPTVHIHILSPIGHHHNREPFRGGMAHLLEHLSVMRSEQFPIRGEANKRLFRYASSLHASTSRYVTEHIVWITEDGFKEAWQIIVSAVFNPFFDVEDIEKEKNIVRAEREQNRSPWGPYGSQEDQLFLSTHFTLPYGNTLEEKLSLVFGSDEDLQAVSVDDLRLLSSLYRTTESKIIVAGPEKIRVHLTLPSVPAVPPLETIIPSTRFRRKKVSQRYIISPQTNTPTYRARMHAPLPVWEKVVALDFLCQFLGVSQGPLFQWAREQNGWAYSVDCDTSWQRDGMMIEVTLPTREKRYAETVCDHWREEVRTRLQKVDWEVELSVRQHANQYGYQSSRRIVSSAVNDLHGYGRIYTETDFHREIERLKSDPPLLALFEEYFSEEVMAQSILLPKN